MAFISTVLADFISLVAGANTAEAGYPGIPRSINMGIRVRLCSDWCLREADGESDYPQTAVSCIVRTQYPYFAQRYAGITGFEPILILLLNFYFKASAIAFMASLVSSCTADLMVTTCSSTCTSFIGSNIPRMIFPANGAQDPFSIRPTVRF